MLGAPGRARAAHIMLFRPVGMERRDDELMPELADFADQSGLAIVALRRRDVDDDAMVAMARSAVCPAISG